MYLSLKKQTNKKTYKEISHNFGGFDNSLLITQPIWGAYWGLEIQEGRAWLATVVPFLSLVLCEVFALSLSCESLETRQAASWVSRAVTCWAAEAGTAAASRAQPPVLATAGGRRTLRDPGRKRPSAGMRSSRARETLHRSGD